MDSVSTRFRERKTVHKAAVAVAPGSILGKLNTFSGGKITNSQNILCNGVSPAYRLQRCWDQTNPLTRGPRGNRAFRTGGPFTSLTVDVNNDFLVGPLTVSNYGKPGVSWNSRTEYTGYFGIPSMAGDPYSGSYLTAGGLDRTSNPFIPLITPSMESAAWNIRPKLEKAGLATALYELKDLPGMLKQTALTFSTLWEHTAGKRGGIRMWPPSAADDYLNFQFGWKPFLGDIQRLLDAVIFSEQYLNDLSRSNNTWVKRARTLEESIVADKLLETLTFGLQPSGFQMEELCQPHVSGGTTFYGTFQLIRAIKKRVWAEGSFKFYRPEFDMTSDEFRSQVMRAKRMITLLGLRINPTHLWQIIPWSWLIDWFTNLGDLIARVDEQYNDGMVAKYLYVMQSQEISLRTFHEIYFWSGTQKFSFERLAASKQRRSADSPYGFVLGGSLSATQWSILGALGLSRNVKFVRS